MALVLNQQEISAKAGEGVYAPLPARTFRISKELEDPCGPATPCKLTGEFSSGLPVVTPITAATDAVYCVIAYDLRKNSFAANDKVKAWVSDEIVWLEASAAIALGACVQIGVNGKVATQVAANPVFGFAESPAGAAGELIAVRMTSPYNVYGAAVAGGE